MKNRHYPIDDLFKNGLESHEIRPSEERREATIHEAVRRRSSINLRRGWLIGLGLFLSTAIIIMIQIFLSQDNIDIRKEELPVSDNLMKPAEMTHSEPIEQVKSTDKHSQGVHKTTTLQYFYDYTRRSGLVYGDYEITSKSSINLPRTSTLNTVPEKGNGIPNTVPDSKGDTIKLQEIKQDSMTSGSETNYLTKKKKETAPSGKLQFAMGIYYIPEWMFNTLDGDKFVNNFGIEGIFRFGPYSIRTGAGLSITKGFHEIGIKSLEYLGSYKAIDSITFSWDIPHYYLIPNYYFSNTQVHDTTPQYTTYTIIKQYSYIQVPLILGYDFLQKELFSLGIRVGPIMSVLINANDLTSMYDPGEDKIIAINNITPDRISLNWQALGGINASFRFSRRFFFELEPNVRYYFNSVYEKSNAGQKPWSVGIRASIMLKF